jgi:hypothetical protein
MMRLFSFDAFEFGSVGFLVDILNRALPLNATGSFRGIDEARLKLVP